MLPRAWAAAGPYPGSILSPRTDKTTVVAGPDGAFETRVVSDMAGGAFSTTRVSDRLGFELQEEARDRASGRRYLSRTRSLSPRAGVDPLWRRWPLWDEQCVVGPYARHPVVLEPTKLREPLASSLHMEARNRQLDDPLESRSLYPLNGPLMRRAYLLDDPLYAPSLVDGPLFGNTVHDDPLYRNSVADAEPWGRRATYLDDPTYRHSAYNAAYGGAVLRHTAPNTKLFLS